MKTEQKRNYAIDFLKVASTALIVLHHYQQVSNTTFETGLNFYGEGPSFGCLVELFFLLSGYFMFDYIEKIKNGLSFKTFYVRRMVRLLPMTAVSVTVAEVLLIAYQTLYGEAFLSTLPSLWLWVMDCLGIRSGWIFSRYGANNPTWFISVLYFVARSFICGLGWGTNSKSPASIFIWA